ncbi:MAG: response regulator, partial [Gammaproteobacteria bacterium]
IWVGRSVDPSPIVALRRTIEVRVAAIAVGLLIVVFMVARLIAVRTERLGRDLTDGIAQVLESDEPVRFSWQRPQELNELGKNLTRLAETHAEHNKALLEYARELEESNRYKSEFLANVSHELRTPLNSILLLSKMLARNKAGKLMDEESRQARVIHDAGTDLTALIDNILDLSRIEARQMSLVCETVDLRKIITDVAELMRPQFDEKHLELKLEIDAGAPQSVASDKEKLRQILINFLSNAVKFTMHGGVTLRLLPVTGREDTGFTVRISVVDTGIGIPASKRELVFEAFKQADGSTSRRFGGTGLGLTISRELARLIGGAIEVESEDNKGSTFSLLLPAEMPAAPQAAVVHDPERVAIADGSDLTIPAANFNGARVLIVDDDMRNLLALTPLLEKWQLDVTAAGDGREALDTLESDANFELVLMDIMMPEMSGYDVIRQLRSRPRFAELPVIALTAKAGEEDRLSCLQAGADDVVVKPIDLVELHAYMDKYLSSVPAAQSSGPQGTQP